MSDGNADGDRHEQALDQEIPGEHGAANGPQGQSRRLGFPAVSASPRDLRGAGPDPEDEDEDEELDEDKDQDDEDALDEDDEDDEDEEDEDEPE